MQASKDEPPTAGSAVLHRDLHSPPDSVIEASGLYFTLSDGRRIFDASGGAAVSCIGHGDPRVCRAMSAQMEKLDYCHSLFFSCPESEDLARTLVDSTDGLMSRAFICNSGSEAMDGAIKLARQYFIEMSPPQPERIRFIARQGSYHGNTIGALAMSGHKARRLIYEPMLSPHISHVSSCNAYRGKRASESTGEYVARLAAELDAEFDRVGPHTVCAFVAEPIVGAALGCVPSVEGYFSAMKAVCDKHGALLILDEVMSGMGRSGSNHAWQQEGVIPDIQTIGKGLGGGYVPIAGLLIGHKVIDALDKGTGCFVHGQTYQAHPMVCAAALEVQTIIKREKLIDNVRLQGDLLGRELQYQFADHPFVGNVRGRGLFWGLEFVSNKTSGEPFDLTLAISSRIRIQALSQDPGFMFYPGTGSYDGMKGDHLIISPPFTVSAEDIHFIIKGLRQAIDDVFEDLLGQKVITGALKL